MRVSLRFRMAERIQPINPLLCPFEGNVVDIATELEVAFERGRWTCINVNTGGYQWFGQGVTSKEATLKWLLARMGEEEEQEATADEQD